MISLDINLTSKVRVRLTEKGQEVLWKEKLSIVPWMRKDYDWVEFELLRFMQIFGAYLTQGGDPLIQNNEVRIVLEKDD